MLEQDIDITILTPLSAMDEKLKKHKTLIPLPDWFREIRYEKRYEFRKEDLVDFDVLFIECGPTNTVFGEKEYSYIEIVSNALSVWDGEVIYYQHSPVLSIPFGEYFSETPIEGRSRLNLRCLCKKGRLFDDKEWIILHHANNEEKWKEMMYCRHGETYKTVEEKVGDKLRFKFIPYCFDSEDPWLDIAKGDKWDLVWIGGRYNSSAHISGTKTDRYPSVKKYYLDTPYRSVVIGKDWEKIKDKSIVGPKGKRNESWKLYNSGYAGMWTDSILVKESGFMTLRPIEIIQSGCLLLGDPDIFMIDKYMDKEYIVKDKNEVKEILEWYNSLSNDEKEEIRLKQYNKFISWDKIDWKDILRR